MALDIGLHYRSYLAAFVSLLGMYRLAPPPLVVADIGTGYGWLAVALARNHAAHVIAVDNNPSRLASARAIAAILGVEQSIEWRLGGLPNLPLTDREADVTFCVEVIEHAGNDPAVVRDLARVTRDMLVISTPNRNCPVIGHDTALPFCHWLPLRMRDRYAALFGRKHLQENNRFWSPSMVSAALPDFIRQSSFLQFPSYWDYRASKRQIATDDNRSLEALKQLWFAASALLGKNSIAILPNLAATYRRSPP